MISDLKKGALSSLNGRWGLGVGSTFLNYLIPAASMYLIGIVVFLIFGLFVDVIGPENLVYYSYGEPKLNFGVILSQIIIWAIIFILYIVVQSVMSYGYYNITLGLAKNESTTIGDLFAGFKSNNIFRAMKLGILQTIFIFLWSLLFIIPGIIKFFSYSMAYYIMLEDPECTASEAIKKSKAMMKGHKLDLLITWLSFIGWFILGSLVGIFTLNLPYLWISPYYTTTVSHFYLKLANKNVTDDETIVI
ncbi:DUF975 family protein [Bacillus mycoides]|uniref:DUF975 family protein n=1 Tax=Bacillus mycoides TaxID=1405 RepID=UPI003D24604E